MLFVSLQTLEHVEFPVKMPILPMMHPRPAVDLSAVFSSAQLHKAKR